MHLDTEEILSAPLYILLEYFSTFIVSYHSHSFKKRPQITGQENDSSFIPIIKIFNINKQCQVDKEPENKSLEKCCYYDWGWYPLQFDGKNEVAPVHGQSWDGWKVHNLEGCQSPFSQHDYWICGCFQSYCVVVFPG